VAGSVHLSSALDLRADAPTDPSCAFAWHARYASQATTCSLHNPRGVSAINGGVMSVRGVLDCTHAGASRTCLRWGRSAYSCDRACSASPSWAWQHPWASALHRQPSSAPVLDRQVCRAWGWRTSDFALALNRIGRRRMLWLAALRRSARGRVWNARWTPASLWVEGRGGGCVSSDRGRGGERHSPVGR